MRLLLALLFCAPAVAADHAEAPGTAGDAAADINDLYAWHKDGRFVAIISFSPLIAAGGDPTYDADVLYTLHIDRNGDNQADAQIHVRFGQDAGGAWGVQAVDVPGRNAPIEGAVGSPIEDGGVKLWAGLADDPFFFDLAGYKDTLNTGTVSFDSKRDSFAGVNVTAIVLDVPLADVSAGSTTLSTWATTARK